MSNALSPSQLINITDNYMTLMSDNGDIREDLRVPDSDIGKDIESKFEAGDDFLVSVLAARGSV